MIHPMCEVHDPFWYERDQKHPYNRIYWRLKNIEALRKEEESRSRPSASFMGTKPDIQIRWKK